MQELLWKQLCKNGNSFAKTQDKSLNHGGLANGTFVCLLFQSDREEEGP